MEQRLPSLKSFAGIDAKPLHTLEYHLHGIDLERIERSFGINREIGLYREDKETNRSATFVHWSAGIFAAIVLGVSLSYTIGPEPDLRTYLLERAYR